MDTSGIADMAATGTITATARPRRSLPSDRPAPARDERETGSVLAATNGMTLYTNEKDTPTKSACDRACASIWPPLLVTGSAMPAPSGLKGTLGTVT